MEKVRQRFHASVAEVDTQDLHQTLTIGVAVVSGEAAQALRFMDEIIRYLEASSQAELTGMELALHKLEHPDDRFSSSLSDILPYD